MAWSLVLLLIQSTDSFTENTRNFSPGLPGSPSDLNTGNGTEVAMVCTSLGSLFRPLFYFLCSNLKANPVLFQFLLETTNWSSKRRNDNLFEVIILDLLFHPSITGIMIRHGCPNRLTLCDMDTFPWLWKLRGGAQRACPFQVGNPKSVSKQARLRRFWWGNKMQQIFEYISIFLSVRHFQYKPFYKQTSLNRVCSESEMYPAGPKNCARGWCRGINLSHPFFGQLGTLV